MLKIRLARTGKKNQPSYRIIVKEARSKRDGAYLENLGTYQPLAKSSQIKLDQNRYQHWLGHGAKPSPTIRHLVAKLNQQSG